MLRALIDRISLATTRVPEPFLHPLFHHGVRPVVATGFNYTAAEVAVHGVKTHGAIDLIVPRGTPILAPADGFYVASYGERLLVDGKGRPRYISPEQAKSGNPFVRHLARPRTPEPWVGYFGSYVVQGWHPPGRYTQIAHVDYAAAAIPFYDPTEEIDQYGHSHLAYNEALRWPAGQYRIAGQAAFIRAGSVIAYSGMTGMGWGERTWDQADFDEQGRPDFRGVSYNYYDEPHVHLMILGRRAPFSRTPRLFDPFGIYGTLKDNYPDRWADWSVSRAGAKHQSLWLPS